MPHLRWIAVASGQGGQHVEHAQALRAAMPGDLRDAWRSALAPCGASVEVLDHATLVRNCVAQPTVAAFQVTAFARLAAALPPPVLIAGYSVGEIAACACAGGYAARDAIEIAAARARLMDEGTDAPSGLAAVLGLDEDEVAALCQRVGVAVAIRNGPRHFVVGGREPALDALIAAALDAGATRACPLPVAVPAHTRWLESAVPRFADVLQRRVRGPLRVPMLSGIDASRVRSTDETVSALSRQLASMLDWAACMEAIAEMRPHVVLELGPGNALARMLSEAAPEVKARSLDDFRDPAAAVAWALRQAE